MYASKRTVKKNDRRRGFELPHVTEKHVPNTIYKQDGYDVAVLKKQNGGVEEKRIDYMVAETFVPNPNGYTKIRHIDGNPENNSADNLEWVE